MKSESDDSTSVQESSRYILANRICFSAAGASLREMAGRREIQLQRPASRCLLLLIQRQGHLVSQHDLMSCAWGEERARFISPNTFYQTLHHLRQSLAQFGLTNVIHTVPRQGTVLSSTLLVRTWNRPGLPMSFSASLRRHRVSVLAGLGIAAAAVLSALLFSRGQLTDRSRDNPFRDHAFSARDACQIYRFPRTLSDNRLTFLLQRAGITCRENMTVFVTTARYGERKSLIACPEYTASRQRCQVYFIMDPFDEKISG
jgi:DNA-binding winged helix-turn-helix (wHTH) protein